MSNKFRKTEVGQINSILKNKYKLFQPEVKKQERKSLYVSKSKLKQID